MALPSTGAISMSQVRSELGLSGSIDLGNSLVRSLAGRASGAISMSDLRGKSAVAGTRVRVTAGSTNSARGYAVNSYGSLSPTSVDGVTIYGITTLSGTPGNLTIWTSGNVPWSKIMYNGVQYNITLITGKINYAIAPIPNIYSQMTGTKDFYLIT